MFHQQPHPIRQFPLPCAAIHLHAVLRIGLCFYALGSAFSSTFFGVGDQVLYATLSDDLRAAMRALNIVSAGACRPCLLAGRLLRERSIRSS